MAHYPLTRDLIGQFHPQFENTYGISVDGSGSLDLKFVTHGDYSDNVGSRVYLLDEGGDNYYMFR